MPANPVAVVTGMSIVLLKYVSLECKLFQISFVEILHVCMCFLLITSILAIKGASRGIGRAVALALGDAGCKVRSRRDGVVLPFFILLPQS